MGEPDFAPALTTMRSRQASNLWAEATEKTDRKRRNGGDRRFHPHLESRLTRERS